MTNEIDFLPEGFGDPMLMGLGELEAATGEFERTGDARAANFLRGVAFARASMRAAGVGVV